MDPDKVRKAHIAARALDYNLCIAQGMMVAGQDQQASIRFGIAEEGLADLAFVMGFDLVPRLDAVKAAREVA